MATDSNREPRYLLGIIGAAVGGAVGYLVFFWMVTQRLYGLVIPPALLGLAAGLGIGGRSHPFAIACAIASLVLGIICEWKFAPLNADGSLSYFITHLHQLKPLTLISLVVGTIISYRLALGMNRSAS